MPGSQQDASDSRLLRTLFDQLPAMMAYWDRDARNVLANAAYRGWFGVDPDQMRGIHISELLGPEVYAKNLPYIRAALAGEEQLFDRTLVDQAGRTRRTQASYVPDVVDGEVRGFFVLVTDVTPKFEAQRAADQAQALARLGSWELDTATGAVTWSRELFNIVGIAPSDSSGTLEALARHVHPDDRDRVLDNIDRARHTGDTYTIEYRLVRADGEEREVVSRGRPVLGPNGEVVRITGTLQDVTESRAAARALAETNAELRRANELNADVIAMLGHDIRTPLTATRGYLELLDDGWDDLPEAEKRVMVGLARSSTEGLTHMVARILSLATVDSGRIEPHPEQLDLAEALPRIMASTGVPATPELVLPGGRPTTCSVDPVHLEQIVGNLLVNADRYGEQPVRVLVERAADHVTVSVTDAGRGVPPEARDSLFTRFARTGSGPSAGGGSGFGLYMAVRLARANGGELTYRPAADGRPHAFVLSLPRGGHDLDGGASGGTR